MLKYDKCSCRVFLPSPAWCFAPPDASSYLSECTGRKAITVSYCKGKEGLWEWLASQGQGQGQGWSRVGGKRGAPGGTG